MSSPINECFSNVDIRRNIFRIKTQPKKEQINKFKKNNMREMKLFCELAFTDEERNNPRGVIEGYDPAEIIMFYWHKAIRMPEFCEGKAKELVLLAESGIGKGYVNSLVRLS
jgi:hypothetical protein